MKKGTAPSSTMPETKKRKILIENQFSIGLRPKKQTLSLKNQFSIGLRPKKQRLSLEN